MKRMIPAGDAVGVGRAGAGKVAKEAKECCQECVSEFISFISSEASDRCQAEKRKTINGEDIIWAMQTLGFDSYIEPLKLFLSKYREAFKGEVTVPKTGGAENGAENYQVSIAPQPAPSPTPTPVVSTDNRQTTMMGHFQLVEQGKNEAGQTIYAVQMWNSDNANVATSSTAVETATSTASSVPMFAAMTAGGQIIQLPEAARNKLIASLSKGGANLMENAKQDKK